MRRTRIAAVTVMVAAGLIGAMAAPASAGKTRTLVGALDKQPGSSVSMKIKLNDEGRPKFVKGFSLSGFSLLCEQDDGSLVSRTFDLQLPGRMRVKQGGQYIKTLENFDGDVNLSVGGYVRRKGKFSSGGFETVRGSSCHGADSFEARKQ